MYNTNNYVLSLFLWQYRALLSPDSCVCALILPERRATTHPSHVPPLHVTADHPPGPSLSGAVTSATGANSAED